MVQTISSISLRRVADLQFTNFAKRKYGGKWLRSEKSISHRRH